MSLVYRQCIQNVNYHPWIARLFDSVKTACFIVAAKFHPVVEFLLHKLVPPSVKRMAEEYKRKIVDKVQRRLNFEPERPQIMSHVIRETEKDGMPIDEINATFLILTNAGSETTATVLDGIMNYLVSDRDKLSTLSREIRERFAGVDETAPDALKEPSHLNSPPGSRTSPTVAPPAGTTCGSIYGIGGYSWSPSLITVLSS